MTNISEEILTTVNALLTPYGEKVTRNTVPLAVVIPTTLVRSSTSGFHAPLFTGRSRAENSAASALSMRLRLWQDRTASLFTTSLCGKLLLYWFDLYVID